MHRCSATDRGRAGFTLLEVVLTLGLGVMLITSIFSVASSTVSLASEISTFQSASSRQKAFLDLCRRTLLQLPPQSRIGLYPDGAGAPRLVIDGDHGAFSLGNYSRGASRVVMYPVRMKSGDTEIRLRYLNETETERMDEGGWEGLGLDLSLLDGIREFRLAFFDPATREWSAEWEFERGRPSLVELKLDFGASPARSVFWVPRIAPPSGTGIPGIEPAAPASDADPETPEEPAPPAPR